MAFSLVVASLFAYAFAWIDFKFKNLLFIGVFALQIVPIQMALVPLLSLFSRGLTINDVMIFPGLELREIDHSFATVWIAHTIFALPLAVFLLHNFIAEIPSEIIEAARVDGAGHGQIFFRIDPARSRRPRSRRSRSSSSYGSGTTCSWRRYSRHRRRLPMTQSLASLSGTWGNQWFLQAAGTFLSILAPLIVFFALQRFFVRGLLAGATKG